MGNCLQGNEDPVEFFQDHDVIIEELQETDDVLTLQLSYKDCQFTFRQYSNGKTILSHKFKGTCQFQTMNEYLLAIQRVTTGGDLIQTPQSVTATIWPCTENPDKKEIRFQLIGLLPAEQTRTADSLHKLCNSVKVNLGSMTLRQQMIAQMTDTQFENFKSLLNKTNTIVVHWTDTTKN